MTPRIARRSRSKRSLLLFAVLALAVVAAGCGKYGTVSDGKSGGNSSGDGDGSVQALRVVETNYAGKEFPKSAMEESGCTAVESVKGGELEDFGAEHVNEPVDYDDNPPTSGSHDPVPLDWGVYDDKDVDDERWVHNMEHGHVVLAWKGLSKEDEKKLLDHRDKAPWHMTVVEREANPEDGVYYLAWHTRLFCAQPNADAMQFFIDNYRDNGPELLMADQPRDQEELDKLVEENDS